MLQGADDDLGGELEGDYEDLDQDEFEDDDDDEGPYNTDDAIDDELYQLGQDTQMADQDLQQQQIVQLGPDGQPQYMMDPNDPAYQQQYLHHQQQQQQQQGIQQQQYANQQQEPPVSVMDGKPIWYQRSRARIRFCTTI